VKVGGSLFDLPDLGLRLHRWLDATSGSDVLLVPGGGMTADVIREWDQRHALGEEAAHWLALRALSLNAHFLARLVPGARVVEQPEHCAVLWSAGILPVLDASTFAVADDTQPGNLPHSWAVTSDSVAARVAIVLGARHLILLKSRAIPEPTDWMEASSQGFVDAHFPVVLQGTTLAVQSVNLRVWQP
jgi:aspartokinase-like uncharacterized kinase